MTLADRVAGALAAAAVPCAVIGAAALAAHGVARSTFDIDLLAVGPRALDPSVWGELERAGMDLEIRRGDASDPLLGVVRVAASGERPVDVIVGRSAWQERAIARARRLAGAAPIVQPRDLILLKLYAGGAQDHWDIQQLLAVADDTAALVAEVDAEIAELPVEAGAGWKTVRGASSP